jgi:LPXTG-motif cell wall-anchored protein
MFSQGDIDKRGIKIMREGQPAQISDFRENDKITATIITSKPPRVMTEKEVAATLAKSTGAGAGASAPAAGAASTPPAAAPAPGAGAAAATSGAEPRRLPKTASPLPVLGLAGLASLVVGLGLTARRRRAAR